jgi:septum site-determining protein MinD
VENDLVAISFVSGKGGTGKTTVALNLGAAMASMGKRVMLVDGDLLTHSLSILCQLEEEKGLTDLFMDPNFPLENAIFDAPGVPNLQVIPSSISFRLLAGMDRLLNREKTFVARRMNEISRSAEYVLIDAPAGVNRDVFFAASMSDKYCLVAETGSADLEGALVFDMFAKRIGLRSIGIIFNRARTEPPESLKMLCGEIFGQVLGVLPFDIRFVEVFEERSIFYQRYPKVTASKNIEQIAKLIINKTQSDNISEPPPSLSDSSVGQE